MENQSDRSTICLNMIVKDEAHVIARCLKSVKPFISTYCIVDTGSSDNTKDVIRDILADIPGVIHDRPWVNFGANRTEALQLARNMAEYTLIMDADDVLVGALRHKLIHDAYVFTINDFGTPHTYVRTHLVRSRLPWRYVGPVHEYITCDIPIGPNQTVLLLTLTYRRYGGGARSKVSPKEKYLRDAAVLEQSLIDDPDNARNVYYLGQSYKDAGEPEKAKEVFERRATMGGFAEETYMALLYLADIIRDEVGASDNECDIVRVQQAYLRAFEYRPTRAEPIYELCHYLSDRQKFQLVVVYAKAALELPIPDDLFIIDREVYDWKLKDCYATASYYVGDKHTARRGYEEILRNRKLPLEQVARVQQNLKFCAEIGELNYGDTRPQLNAVESGFGPFLDQLRKNISSGGTELATQLTLFSLAVSIRAETIIEVGRFRGASTYALASALKFLKVGWQEVPEAHQRPGIDYDRLENSLIDRRLYSVEAYPLPEVREMIEANGLSEFVGFLDKKSELIEHGDIHDRMADLIFIDGDHTYNGCMNDVLRFLPMLRQGGLFILHDYYGWFDKDGNNNSPIKQVCDAISNDYEHLLIDSNYMSFMIFRKNGDTKQSDKETDGGSTPSM